VKARFIPLGIEADQPCRVGKLAEKLKLRTPVLLHKQAVKFCVECLAAAEHGNQSRYIVLHDAR